MHLTFRQLQLFLALVEHGSISAAARACHVTQPTVSMQLRELSESVGLPLYEQLGRRLSLTEAGRELAASARVTMDEWAAFDERLQQLKGLERGHLRLAVVSTAESFIPARLASFCREHPGIDIRLEVLNRDGVVRRLRDNLDDVSIMSMPPEDLEIEREAFMANPLVMIAAASHPLARRRSLSLDQLAGERFVLREPGSGTRLACERHFAAQGFQPRVQLQLGSNEAIRRAVAAGMGVGLISQHALGSALEAADLGLVVLRTRGFPIHSNWFIVTLRGKRLSPSAAAFLAHLRQAAPGARDRV